MRKRTHRGDEGTRRSLGTQTALSADEKRLIEAAVNGDAWLTTEAASSSRIDRAHLLEV
jgi:hypothetical protein